MRFYISFGSIAFMSLPLMAALPENIDSLMRAEQYEKAISLLEPLAAQGNAEAQNRLGEAYHFSGSNLRDYKKAKEWYLKAVEKGNGEAANHLGRIYLNGEGVKKDPSKAEYWYKKGMDLGNMPAEINYYNSKDNAFFYVLQRALEGDPQACQIVARLYRTGGMGITKNEKKAEYWKHQYGKLSKNSPEKK